MQVPGGPAALSGAIKVGDVIYEVGGVCMRGKTTHVLSGQVVGLVGSQVSMTVSRSVT